MMPGTPFFEQARKTNRMLIGCLSVARVPSDFRYVGDAAHAEPRGIYMNIARVKRLESGGAVVC